MGGKILSQQEGTIIVYSYKKDNKPKIKRRSPVVKQKKEIANEEEFKKEVVLMEQTSLLDLEDNK